MLTKRASAPVWIGDDSVHSVYRWRGAVLAGDSADGRARTVEYLFAGIHLYQVARIIAPVGVARRIKAHNGARPVHRSTCCISQELYGQPVTVLKEMDGLRLLSVLVGVGLALTHGCDDKPAAGHVLVWTSHARAVSGVVFGVGLRRCRAVVPCRV